MSENFWPVTSYSIWVALENLSDNDPAKVKAALDKLIRRYERGIRLVIEKRVAKKQYLFEADTGSSMPREKSDIGPFRLDASGDLFSEFWTICMESLETLSKDPNTTPQLRLSPSKEIQKEFRAYWAVHGGEAVGDEDSSSAHRTFQTWLATCLGIFLSRHFKKLAKEKTFKPKPRSKAHSTVGNPPEKTAPALREEKRLAAEERRSRIATHEGEDRLENFVGVDLPPLERSPLERLEEEEEAQALQKDIAEMLMVSDIAETLAALKRSMRSYTQEQFLLFLPYLNLSTDQRITSQDYTALLHQLIQKGKNLNAESLQPTVTRMRKKFKSLLKARVLERMPNAKEDAVIHEIEQFISLASQLRGGELKVPKVPPE